MKFNRCCIELFQGRTNGHFLGSCVRNFWIAGEQAKPMSHSVCTWMDAWRWKKHYNIGWHSTSCYVLVLSQRSSTVQEALPRLGQKKNKLRFRSECWWRRTCHISYTFQCAILGWALLTGTVPRPWKAILWNKLHSEVNLMGGWNFQSPPENNFHRAILMPP